MPQTSLSAISPEAIAHGTEITILVNGIKVGEVNEVDYDEDNKLDATPVLGSRIIGRRRGQLEGKFTMKGYWLNAALRSIVEGGPVSLSGVGSSIYASTEPFLRFDLVVQSALATSPSCKLMGCIVEKDSVKWSHDKVSTDDVSGYYEDRYGQ